MSRQKQFSRLPMCEPLEGRTLLSGAMMMPMMPSIGSVVAGDKTANPPAVSIATSSSGKLTYTKVKGTYRGTYTRGGHTYNFVIQSTQFTHTGHFSGTVNVSGVPVVGTVNATFTGRIRTNRHFTVNFSGTGFSGTLVGVASHTGGHLTGTYTITGLVNDSGPFDIGK
jgi:hypothetical protein